MSLWLKIDRWISKAVILIAGFCLVIMVAAVVVNVLGRGLFDAPIYGTVEIVSLGGLFVTSFAIGYTERKRGHIVIRIMVRRLPERLRSLFVAVSFFLSLCMVALLVWGGFWMAMDDATTPGATTYVLHLNKAPFRFTWVLGCIVLCGFLLHHLLEALDQVRKK
ncbi:MAG: TRAP transporter small permease [Deltaproteobacteria bacterium]|nr:MAG: TRAP transporter small permease [Deltaproteobacteria bacterium]